MSRSHDDFLAPAFAKSYGVPGCKRHPSSPTASTWQAGTGVVYGPMQVFFTQTYMLADFLKCLNKETCLSRDGVGPRHAILRL